MSRQKRERRAAELTQKSDESLPSVHHKVDGRHYLRTVRELAIASIGSFLIGVMFNPLMERLPIPIPTSTAALGIFAGLLCIVWTLYRESPAHDSTRIRRNRIFGTVWAFAIAVPIYFGIRIYAATPIPPLPDLLVPDNRKIGYNCRQNVKLFAALGTAVFSAPTLPWNAVSFVDKDLNLVDPVLVLDRGEGESLLLSAIVRAEDRSVVAKIHNNKVVTKQTDAQVEWLPGNHGLIVRDQFDDVVLEVDFANPKAVVVKGVFRHPGFPTVTITGSEITATKDGIQRGTLSRSCIGGEHGLLVDPERLASL